jgi:hypothetical protein
MMGCLALALTIYFTYYRIQKSTNDQYPLKESVLLVQAKFMRMVPSTGYSLLIIPINMVYKKLATFLTDFGKSECEFFI